MDDEGSSPTYDRPLRLNDGQYEITLPADLADKDGLSNGDRFEFVPELDKGTIVLRATITESDGRNVRRLRRAGEWDQAYLRFPKEIAEERGWDELVERDGGAKVTVDRHGSADYRIRTWPATKPWFTPTAGDTIASTSIKRLVEVDSGPGVEYTQYRLELPSEHVDAYGLEPGDKVATRLTARDGDLMLALDLSVGAAEVDDLHVRTVMESGVTKTESGDYSHLGVLVSKTYVDALGLAGVDLEVVPEDGQLLLRPA